MSVRYVEVGDMTIDATPNFSVNENGVICADWGKDGTLIKDMILLFDSQDRPINAANEYLFHCKTVDKSQDVRSIAKGLMHFFDFLERHEICWDQMPRPRNQRPLYRFRDYLQALHDDVDLDTGKRKLASTTAKSYRGAAVGMYVYWLGHGKLFQRDPCRFFDAHICDERVLGHINRYIKVQMTDLKLTARDKVKNNKLPNHLSPLLKKQRPELQALQTVLQNRRGYTQVRGEYLAKQISIETCIAVLLALYTGMRRLEVLTFSSTMVRASHPGEEAITVMIGPNVCCHTKGGESGEIKVPTWLMKQLADYKQTSRYKRRLTKFITQTTDPFARRYPPLLLNNQGLPYNENSLNARWGEIRNAIRLDHAMPGFAHKFHNLRSTYATYLTIALLQLTYPNDHAERPNEPVLTRDQVEAEVQARLRHTSPQTTALYVKFWEDHYLGRQSDRVHQEGLDKIYGNDGTIGVWNNLLHTGR
ncbi:hypothetical protein ACEUBB_10875 [Aeromonas rivipollensis]|uniref:hypothetical protein n=1 Tax=Aeromonas rivipollensis TaxID=948519 RepID=UPI0038D17AC7